MGAAMLDLRARRIAIAPALIAGIAAHQVGDEETADARLRDHAPQEIARAITAERDARAVAAQAPRRETHEHHRGRNRAGPRYYARAARHQRRAAPTAEHRLPPITRRVRRPDRRGLHQVSVCRAVF